MKADISMDCYFTLIFEKTKRKKFETEIKDVATGDYSTASKKKGNKFLEEELPADSASSRPSLMTEGSER